MSKMKPLEYLPPSATSAVRGWNAVVVLIVVNCLLLVFQVSSNANLFTPSRWWPSSSLQPMPCANASLALDEHLDMSSIDLSHGELRSFRAHGIASRLIVEVGSYRTGASSFSSVVMTSKRLNNLHEILYECEWVAGVDHPALRVSARVIKPDWDMGALYGTMVLVCEFARDVGTDGHGGSLVLTASYPDAFRAPERFTVLTEIRGDWNATKFQPPYPYEITFCGSPLYGNISPQRVREWVAYHAYFFGNRTLFLFHDAGGVHDEVYRVLKPWMDLGVVRLANLRRAEVYEGYYHHQFTMLNDCLLRSQTLSNWTFFFDVDELLYIPGQEGSSSKHPNAIERILKEMARNETTQIRFRNIQVSDAPCLEAHPPLPERQFREQLSRKWAFEKLVYAKCDYGWETMESRKYALQPQRVWATGVHYSEHMKLAKQQDMDPAVLRSYHSSTNASRFAESFQSIPTGCRILSTSRIAPSTPRLRPSRPPSTTLSAPLSATSLLSCSISPSIPFIAPRPINLYTISQFN